ncbi:MAG: 6-bladed beta-propeller [Balneolia bacterium]|nr:6-bladed beta-propeller [Balneolia bacterium]
MNTIGRSGRGPGEFQEISAFTIGSEDRIIIFDRFFNGYHGRIYGLPSFQ